jgi:threonine aldolase
MMYNRARIREIQLGCTRFLSGHGLKTGRMWLESLLESPSAGAPQDFYGEGEVVADLEKQMAELLGKESAIFVIKGVIAQLAAMRIWTDKSACATVALHPKSHIDLDEESAYQRLHALQPIRLGNYNPFTVKDLEAVKERIGLVVVELPLRMAGYKLPTWEELTAISVWCKEKQIPLHFDGARLWESAPYYGRSLAEIAALADSVYVSFYKGLGGMGGCALAGSKEFVEQAKFWGKRHGGSLFTVFPYVLSAKIGLEQQLPKMESFHVRAVELAAALAELPGVTVAPNPPHTNAFQMYLPGETRKLVRASLQIAEEQKIWLWGGFNETALPALFMAEVSVGSATAALSNQEVVNLIAELIERAGQVKPEELED